MPRISHFADLTVTLTRVTRYNVAIDKGVTHYIGDVYSNGQGGWLWTPVERPGLVGGSGYGSKVVMWRALVRHHLALDCVPCRFDAVPAS